MLPVIVIVRVLDEHVNKSTVVCSLISFLFFYDTEGLIWVSEWNPLQQPVASAFLATLYSDYMITSKTHKLNCDSDSFTPEDLRDFAKSQVTFHYHLHRTSTIL